MPRRVHAQRTERPRQGVREGPLALAYRNDQLGWDDFERAR
jgi:hypothetical protein